MGDLRYWQGLPKLELYAKPDFADRIACRLIPL
jgi:hypothetical protein